MLKNGKFIKEKPIKIGVHYVPPPPKVFTDEDRFVQYVFMGYKPPKRKHQFGVAAYLTMAYVALIGVALLANILAGILFG